MEYRSDLSQSHKNFLQPIKFSIVTASFNAAGTIADTLRSVRAQDYPYFEHLVIDGASTDNTVRIVQEHRHGGLTLVSEPDQGCYDAMNKGLRLATGDVVVFLNADDFFARPDALSVAARAFQQTDADCVVGCTALVDYHNIRRVRRYYRGTGFRNWMLWFGHMPPHPSFYARRDILMAIDGFDTSFKISADFDQMVRLFVGRKAKLATVPETLAGFRIGGISTRDWQARAAIDREIASSLKRNGLFSTPFLRWVRYPFKALQMTGRPRDYPDYLTRVGLYAASGSNDESDKQIIL